jgi:hypothetical protein
MVIGTLAFSDDVQVGVLCADMCQMLNPAVASSVPAGLSTMRLKAV